jgi:hypothetical protein
MQTSEENLGGEAFVQRLRTQVPNHPVYLIHQPDPPELAGIVEHQLDILIKPEHQPVVGRCGEIYRPHKQVPTHAQVEEQPIARKLEIQELPSTINGLDHLSDQA